MLRCSWLTNVRKQLMRHRIVKLGGGGQEM